MPWLTVGLRAVLGLLPMPSDARKIIATVAEATVVLVVELTGEGFKHLDGPSKMKVVVKEVADFLHDSLKDVPVWKGLSTFRQDRIISGIAELALFIMEVVAAHEVPEKAGLKLLRAKAGTHLHTVVKVPKDLPPKK